MENPNVVNMRRRYTAPTSPSRLSPPSLFRIVQQRHNPYVGTFRHSPPSFSSRERMMKFLNDSSLATQFAGRSTKNSPYVGSFRHAPPSWVSHSSDLYHLFFPESRKAKSNKYKSQSTSKELFTKYYISGHLRGGSPSNSKHQYFYNYQHQQLLSPTLSFPLRRVVGWILQPFHETIVSSIKAKSDDDDSSSIIASSDADSRNDIDDASSLSHEDYDSNDEYSVDDQIRQEENDLTVKSSEPYNPHSLIKDILDDDRLDYTITQMDVIRMMRNASRHLDVDSILQLPVTTFCKKIDTKGVDENLTRGAEEDSTKGADSDEEKEMSWLLISEKAEPNKNDAASPKNNSHSEDKNADADVCVICLEHFVDGDRVRNLPCQHSFHVGCIDRWLSGSHSFENCITSGCPTCKKRPVEDLETEGETEYFNYGDSVPSWAFSRIGDALARNMSE